MPNPESLTSSARSRGYETLSGNVDLVAEFGGPCRAIRVGEAGDLCLEYAGGVQDTIWNVQPGELLLVHAYKIIQSGTTATKITAFP